MALYQDEKDAELNLGNKDNLKSLQVSLIIKRFWNK